jgi:hypothetical protein
MFNGGLENDTIGLYTTHTPLYSWLIYDAVLNKKIMIDGGCI